MVTPRGYRVAGSDTSISQADPQVARRRDGIGVERDELRHGERLRNGDRGDGGGSQRDHRPELPFCDHAYGRRTEPQAQQAVERRGAAATLEVPQYDRARLLARHFLDRVGDLVADSAEALVLGIDQRSEERRVGKGVDLGGRRIIKKKKRREKW